MFLYNSGINPFKVEINGVEQSGILSGKVTTSMEQLCGEFSFTTTLPNNLSYNIKRGDECRILIYNVPVITGFVNTVSSHIDINTHNISISGRDKTCDLVDNTLPAHLSMPNTMQSITKKVLDYFNITDIDVVIDTEEEIKPFDSTEVVAVELAESAFDFLEKYAKKRQLLLTTDGDGNVVYTRANEEVVNDFINISNGFSKGTVLSVDANFDDTKRFYHYILNSQTNASGAAVVNDFTQIPPEIETYSKAETFDSEIRKTRTLNFIPTTNSMDQQSLNDRVLWEANVRRANGFSYTLVVQGFKNIAGNVWRPNMQVNVIDKFNDINTYLMILSVTYEMSLDDGLKTTMVLTTPEAFTTKSYEEKAVKKGKKNKQIGGMFQNLGTDEETEDEGGEE